MRREAGTQRLSRLLDIYLRIATTPRRWTRAHLADHYELSPRQLQKDLDEIRHRLNPSLRRTRSGYYFERLPMLSPLTYSLAEALALLEAARAGAVLAGIDAADLAAALARLETVLPPELRPLLPPPEARPASEGGRHRVETLRVLELALARRRRVRVQYAAASHGGEVRERLFEPYVVAPYLRSWHVIGYCHLRQGIRTFKVDRIVGVTPTDEPYTIPADFDAADYLGRGASWGLIVGAGAPEAVVLRFSPLAGRWVREEEWHPSQRVEVEPDGHVRLHLRVAITPEFCRWVFHYGREVEVLAPASLRAWVVDEARAVLAAVGRGQANDRRG